MKMLLVRSKGYAYKFFVIEGLALGISKQPGRNLGSISDPNSIDIHMDLTSFEFHASLPTSKRALVVFSRQTSACALFVHTNEFTELK